MYDDAHVSGFVNRLALAPELRFGQSFEEVLCPAGHLFQAASHGPAQLGRGNGGLVCGIVREGGWIG